MLSLKERLDCGVMFDRRISFRIFFAEENICIGSGFVLFDESFHV